MLNMNFTERVVINTAEQPWQPRAPYSLISEQQSSLKLPQARRHSEGIVALFRAVATPHEAITGAPGRAIAE